MEPSSHTVTLTGGYLSVDIDGTTVGLGTPADGQADAALAAAGLIRDGEWVADATGDSTCAVLWDGEWSFGWSG